MLVIVVFILVSIFFISLILKSIAKRSYKMNPYRRDPVYNQDYYVLSCLYYNPDDKRTFVPKRTNPGFTVNFARPLVILITLILAGWLVMYLS